MPTMTPPPDAPDVTTLHPVDAVRGGDGSAVGSAAPPPEDLLPSGGTDHRGARLDLALLDGLFRLEVDGIRRQLAPVRSRLALASSYGREAGRRDRDARPGATSASVTPLQVAYALRWLELADVEPRVAAWVDLLDGPLD